MPARNPGTMSTYRRIEALEVAVHRLGDDRAHLQVDLTRLQEHVIDLSTLLLTVHNVQTSFLRRLKNLEQWWDVMGTKTIRPPTGIRRELCPTT